MRPETMDSPGRAANSRIARTSPEEKAPSPALVQREAHPAGECAPVLRQDRGCRPALVGERLLKNGP